MLPSPAIKLAFTPLQLGNAEFQQFREFMHRVAGISLRKNQEYLVTTRLAGHLRRRGFASYAHYINRLHTDAEEQRITVDLLTTNETSFFREPAHFDFLRDQVALRHTDQRPLRVWSAACSSGEEAYSIAMILAETLGANRWEVLASDVCTRVLETARQGIYRLDRGAGIPAHFMKKYCLRGIGSRYGEFKLAPFLQQPMRFMQCNLNRELPDLEAFDVIFLRNTMIYFDVATRAQVVRRLMQKLRRTGLIIISHTENLQGFDAGLSMLQPSIYQRYVA